MTKKWFQWDDVTHTIPAAVQADLDAVTDGKVATAMAPLPATYAPRVAASAKVAPILTTHARTLLPVVVKGRNPATGRLVGVATDSSTFRWSDDNGTTWTEMFVGPFGAWGPGVDAYSIQFDTAAGFMFAAGTDGKIYRSPVDVYTAPWTVLTPPTPAGTTAQPFSLCIPTTGVLLYGNYNADTPAVAAYVYRSTNGGTSWSTVLTLAGARHVHAIQADPRHAGWVWATVGDSPAPGSGVYLSQDNGATWTKQAGNRYGIAMAFPAAFQGAQEIVAMEGDGLNQPHTVAYSTALVGTVDPLAWFDLPPANAASNRGTGRGIIATPQGDLVYFITPEGGAVGSHAGIYVAQGPTYTQDLLLEDLTGIEPAGYVAGFVSGAYVIQGTMRFTLPTFAGGNTRS